MTNILKNGKVNLREVDQEFLIRMYDKLIEWKRPELPQKKVGFAANNLAHLPLTIIADLHGQFFDLRTILKSVGDSKTHWLFLGDYVDRGRFGVEIFCFLLILKTLSPQKFFLLLVYGFYDECLEKYEDKDKHLVYYAFIDIFNHLPIAASVDSTILAMHGGISPHIKELSELDSFIRPSFIPMYGRFCDVVWADPGSDKKGWAMSTRGVSFTFHEDVLEEFCVRNKIELICRGHQLGEAWNHIGYNFTGNGKLVTLFSAPNYLGNGTSGAVMTVSEQVEILN